MTGIEAEIDAGELQHPLDFPYRFDMRAGLVMEGRLVAPLTAASDRRFKAIGKALPAFLVETELTVGRRLARMCLALIAAEIGQRRLGLEPAFGNTCRIEHIKENIEL